MLITEYEFELPKGYVDAEGTLHRGGLMRLATGADEILPMKDPRVQNLPAYLIVILLARVVTKLGGVASINPGLIENLFSEDLTFLQNMYNRINGLASPRIRAHCPNCAEAFELEVPVQGGSWATP
jgi:hypothetical protein